MNEITFRPSILDDQILVVGTCEITGREIGELVKTSWNHLRALRVSIDPSCSFGDFIHHAQARFDRAQVIRRRRSALRAMRREMNDLIDAGLVNFDLALRIERAEKSLKN